MSSTASDSPSTVSPQAPAWRRIAESRYVLGAGYVVAVILTLTGALLASRPPEVGPISAGAQAMLWLLGFNLVLIVALASLVALRVARLLINRNADAGARLQLRFMAIFGMATVAPAIVVALFFGGVVISGVDYWFSRKVRTIVDNSASALRTYVDEQTRFIGDNTTLIGSELNQAPEALGTSPVVYSHYLGQLAQGAFTAAYILDSDGRIMARWEGRDAPPFLAPPESSFKVADEGHGITSAQTFPSSDLFRGLYKLQAYQDAYLYVVRPASPGMLTQLREAEAQLVSYREADDNKLRLQAAFALTYVETVLLLLVGAAWLAIPVGNSIAAPVARLVQASGRIANGDLDVRVEVDGQTEEMAMLSQAFNNMTHDLQVQQVALRTASLDAESRRQFIETVLSGVSAGVMGLDQTGAVSAANSQAAALLGLEPAALAGKTLREAAPELLPVADRAAEIRAEAEEEVDITRNGETRRLRARASGAAPDGVVLTFDDITRLVTAQRNAAWRDVARRIAHEIKNPLTPIQLSAERIRRKYRKEIASDLDTFDRCTDTIIRQVGDIGRMVDEFSSFARMPAPRFAETDPAELLRAAVFAQRVASPEIEVELDEPPSGLVLSCDERMVGQALANILKNAAEAVSARNLQPGEGRIHASLRVEDRLLTVVIEDNGVGLPPRDRDRLTEPYVTTREKGTGLGLAIVKRILEDHGGEVALGDASSLPGARVSLCFPLARGTAAPEVKEAVHDG